MIATRPLSQAIREEAKLGPQAFEAYFGDGNASCALGAAALALEVSPLGLLAYYSEELATMTTCPACGAGLKGPVREIICHLNGEHKWKREDISTWLEQPGR